MIETLLVVIVVLMVLRLWLSLRQDRDVRRLNQVAQLRQEEWQKHVEEAEAELRRMRQAELEDLQAMSKELGAMTALVASFQEHVEGEA